MAITLLLEKMKRRELLARTIYGEARGDGALAMRAVAHVVLNRATIGGWWGATVTAVILKDYQFSMWNKSERNSSNTQKALNATMEDPVYATAYKIAGEVLLGQSADPTYGATHYHTTYVNPDWRDDTKITAYVGNHIFYRGIA